MNALDIIILLCFIPAIIQGVRKGLVCQIFDIVSVIAGAWLSYRFSGLLCKYAAPYIEASEALMHVIAFTVIMIAAVLIFRLIGKGVEAVVKLVLLGWLNKLLGVVFAVLKTGLILGILIILFNTVNAQFGIVKEEVLSSSVLYEPLKNAAYSVFPYFKELLTKI
ncbi:MAG: CvpA family protein [Bacteroidales bacterium]|nr:CvpA family protein [Bacteroidales bacterium]MBQ1857379.1 CvpA family protein [Bacteroidales bacterium]MBQ2109420.1 CvpA family protein [Bacteroidales bacterium]MBQ3917083.1 CvpA family protein [Bacteroidales bacterium]MEE3407053.1 CvpA family protein [Candidatus Cryptobacteroides sp.]